MRIAIMADDLSGALNIGAEFSQAGHRTEVSYDAAAGPAARVWIVNSETRNRLPAEAYQINQHLAAQMSAWSPQLWVKKIDSLLRGNIGAELDALRQATGQRRCVVVAAAPTLGRIVREGICYIDGDPLADVRDRLDPSSQVNGSSVPEIIGAQSNQPVRHLNLAEIRQDIAAIIPVIQGHMGIVTVDCTSQADLNKAIDAGYQAGVRLFAGTYGLGKGLLSLRPPVLTLLGSMSSTSHQQAHALSQMQGVVTVAVPVNPVWMAAEPQSWATPYQAQVVAAAHQGASVLLHVVDATDGAVSAQLAQQVEQALQWIIQPALMYFTGFIAAGGATANALYQLLGAEGMVLGAEVLPGIPLSFLRGGSHAGAPFVAKPGSQGSEMALWQLMTRLQQAVQQGTAANDFSHTTETL